MSDAMDVQPGEGDEPEVKLERGEYFLREDPLETHVVFNSLHELEYSRMCRLVSRDGGASHVSLDDEYPISIADKREKLEQLYGYLKTYADSLKDSSHKTYLKTYADYLRKKIQPVTLREKWLYMRVPAHELDEMRQLTFLLIFNSKRANYPLTPGLEMDRDKELNVSSERWRKINEHGLKLAEEVSSYKGLRIAGGLAMAILGAALVVGAGCMIGASYGALSPFAVTVAKFGLGICSVGAAYIFAELMGQAGPALYHKFHTKEKKDSTAVAMRELCKAARVNSVAKAVKKIAVRGAVAGGVASLSGTANAAINSTVLPGASVAATGAGTLPVAGMLAAMASTLGAGVMAMCRGTLFAYDGVVRERMSAHARNALQTSQSEPESPVMRPTGSPVRS